MMRDRRNFREAGDQTELEPVPLPRWRKRFGPPRPRASSKSAKPATPPEVKTEIKPAEDA